MTILKRPPLSEMFFAFKCCAAGMLAVYIALDIGLDRPFWALTTAYGQKRTGSAARESFPTDKSQFP